MEWLVEQVGNGWIVFPYPMTREDAKHVFVDADDLGAFFADAFEGSN